MEVIDGCENKQALLKVLDALKTFELVQIEIQDVDWAHDKLAEFRLSHNVDPFDCLIASTPHRLQIPLYTRNLKHFTPLIGELAIQPY
jgi:predicted nucleic acid-binding protein